MSQPEDNKSFMDRGTLIALVLVVAFWLGWSRFMDAKYPKKPDTAVATATEAAKTSGDSANSTAAGNATGAKSISAATTAVGGTAPATMCSATSPAPRNSPSNTPPKFFRSTTATNFTGPITGSGRPEGWTNGESRHRTPRAGNAFRTSCDSRRRTTACERSLMPDQPSRTG